MVRIICVLVTPCNLYNVFMSAHSNRDVVHIICELVTPCNLYNLTQIPPKIISNLYYTCVWLSCVWFNHSVLIKFLHNVSLTKWFLWKLIKMLATDILPKPSQQRLPTTAKNRGCSQEQVLLIVIECNRSSKASNLIFHWVSLPHQLMGKRYT